MELLVPSSDLPCSVAWLAVLAVLAWPLLLLRWRLRLTGDWGLLEVPLAAGAGALASVPVRLAL